MNNLYYGSGDCSIQGYISSISIAYRGALLIKSNLPSGYSIVNNKNILEIDTELTKKSLSELFSYIGEFRILSVTAKDLQGEKAYITINRVMDYSELINTKSEDLTTKSEDLNASYIHGRKCRETRILHKVNDAKFKIRRSVK